jgi:hypothetical protein
MQINVLGKSAITALGRPGGISTPAVLSYLADMNEWDGLSVPFGSTNLSQSEDGFRPALIGDFLVFDNDYIATRDPILLQLLEADEFEISVIYRPTSQTQGCIFSAGQETVGSDTGVNNDNTIQLYALNTGHIRFLIDGTGGVGAQSFTTSSNYFAGMVVGNEYLITCVVSGGFFRMNIAGVPVIDDVLITGLQPSGMNVFAVGCRKMLGATNFCDGDVKMIEVREVLA